MNIPEFISRYVWIAFIAVTLVYAGIVYKRSRTHIAIHPELEDGYRAIVKGIMIWLNIPWVIMGAGIVFGGLTSIDQYSQPMDGNIFVVGLHVSIFVTWILGTYWLFYKGGAELLATHPGVINLKSASSIKAIWLLCLVIFISGVLLEYYIDGFFTENR